MSSPLADLAINSEGEVVLRVEYNPCVASRVWYTLEWTDADGKPQRASSINVDTLFKRVQMKEPWLKIREREEA